MTGNRIARFRFLDGQGRWVPMMHSPADLLQWATDLRPDVFQRTFSMFPAFSLDRPIPGGFTVGTFLDELARAAGGYHTPRLDPSGMTSAQVLDLSARLLDMPLTPKLRFLSIDNLQVYEKQYGPPATEKLLHDVFAQGWDGLELLICGGGFHAIFRSLPTYGTAATVGFDLPAPDYAFCGQLSAWDTNTTCRDLVRQQNPGARLLMYLDAPAESDCFKQLGPDGMAAILTKVAAEQASLGFTFIWPIVQVNPPPNDKVGQWDSTQYVLSDGRRLYDVERDLMARYNPKA